MAKSKRRTAKQRTASIKNLEIARKKKKKGGFKSKSAAFTAAIHDMNRRSSARRRQNKIDNKRSNKQWHADSIKALKKQGMM